MTTSQEKQILEWYENVIPLSCLKSAIRFYRQGTEPSAGQLLVSEQDKLRNYPELVLLLKEFFPTYKDLLEKP